MSEAAQHHTGLHNTVHHVLARSYSFYFLFFIIGVVLDAFFPLPVFRGEAHVQIGIILLMLSSLLILWAQNTSRNLKKHTVSKETFLGGPYSFTRSPTHWGLFFLTLGFGIMANSFLIMLFTLISLAITRAVFLKREEEILEAKYGAPYLEYKKMVRI
ncbi:MAG: methyltransferase [bacterium]